MLRILFFTLAVILFFSLSTKNAYAVEDTLTIENNKFGVHILFTSELEKARELVNSNGGDWGYVTIPVQAHDKNLEKWQKFMDEAKKLHLIPIVRIATENHYFETSVWRKPTAEDILDFANFLNSLNWPVKNRYVVVFNEVNRGDEWQGSPNASEYAQILNFAVDIFKSLNDDFFIISAGLDNAAANVSGKSQNQYDFMIQMDREIPQIFGKIDGLGSHSYPNPAFSVPPWVTTNKSITSFKLERDLAFQLSGKNLPVFITETGWSSEKVTKSQIASYFTYAFENVWSDERVVAVTPFLLEAGPGPFFQFTLLNEGGGYNEISRSIQRISKIKGNPTINALSASHLLKNTGNIPFKTFPKVTQYDYTSSFKVKAITPFFKWLLRISDES